MQNEKLSSSIIKQRQRKHVAVDPELHRRLKEVAANQEVSIKQLIQTMLDSKYPKNM